MARWWILNFILFSSLALQASEPALAEGAAATGPCEAQSAVHQIRDFFRQGRYRGFTPTDESAIGLGEIDMTIKGDQVKVRIAGGLGLHDFSFSLNDYRALNDAEAAAFLKHKADKHGVMPPVELAVFVPKAEGALGPEFLFPIKRPRGLARLAAAMGPTVVLRMGMADLLGPTFMYSPMRAHFGPYHLARTFAEWSARSLRSGSDRVVIPRIRYGGTKDKNWKLKQALSAIGRSGVEASEELEAPEIRSSLSLEADTIDFILRTIPTEGDIDVAALALSADFRRLVTDRGVDLSQLVDLLMLRRPELKRDYLLAYEVEAPNDEYVFRLGSNDLDLATHQHYSLAEARLVQAAWLAQGFVRAGKSIVVHRPSLAEEDELELPFLIDLDRELLEPGLRPR